VKSSQARRGAYPESPVLVIDDDEAIRTSLSLILSRAGIDNVVATADSAEAAALVVDEGVSLIFLDLFLPSETGEILLKDFSRVSPRTPVIVITGASQTETIVRCMRAGAVDYLVKPIDETRLLVSTWNALASFELRREAEGFRDRAIGARLERPEVFAKIVTREISMLAIFGYIEAIAKSRQPVLITGETGTGKELLARAVHDASGRAGRFVAVNVAGLDDAMFSDTLFGHSKGAYTGADSARGGLIKEAEGGTLLLDEVGDLEPRSQVKILRLLQDGEYYPLGSDIAFRSSARIVAATTLDLASPAAAGSFRSDLFYRLQTHPIKVPPLRARPKDLRPLVAHFMAESARELGFARTDPDERSVELVVGVFKDYPFPGNVRELESLVHDAMAGARGWEPRAEALRERIGVREPPPLGIQADYLEGSSSPLARTLSRGEVPRLDEAEREIIALAVEKTEGNLTRAAQILGISRQTLYSKLKSSNGP
jgi:DNA-binding NtrC family response regulator